MFKVGDIVVCMSYSMSGYHNSEQYNIFRVDFVSSNEYFYGDKLYDRNLKGIASLCESKHFILLTELRKEKINRICSKLVI